MSRSVLYPSTLPLSNPELCIDWLVGWTLAGSHEDLQALYLELFAKLQVG